MSELLAGGFDAYHLCFLINSAGLVVTKHRPNRLRNERWVIFSPHCDDAALSMGGLISRFAHEVDITIVTLTGPSRCAGTCSPLYGKTETVTQIRKAEDSLYGCLMGVSMANSDIEDVELYIDNDGKHWADHIMDHPSEFGIGLFENAMEKYFSRNGIPDKIFVPLAVGAHADHAATHIALENLRERLADQSPQSKFYYYEDLPYCAYEPTSLQQRLSEISNINPVNVEINFKQKLQGVSIYRSQYLPSDIGPTLYQHHLKGEHPNRATIERFWRVD